MLAASIEGAGVQGLGGASYTTHSRSSIPTATHLVLIDFLIRWGMVGKGGGASAGGGGTWGRPAGALAGEASVGTERGGGGRRPEGGRRREWGRLRE